MRSLPASLLLAAASLRVGRCDDGRGADDAQGVGFVGYRLTTGLEVPLIGYGVGNLPAADVPRVVEDQLRAGVLLVDTARKSDNERLIAAAVEKFDAEGRARTRGGSAAAAEAGGLPPLHVVTKVWYTHLGYERTKLSIRESIENLSSASPRKIYVHMLIHWPRCDDAIPWMHCAEEEDALPQSVKDLGPPPHLDKDNAFKESWRAMEEAYEADTEHSSTMWREAIFTDHVRQKEAHKAKEGTQVKPIIASIGVSNFELGDLDWVMQQRHPPQIYQGSSWRAFHDPELMDVVRERHILYQSYGVLSQTLQQQGGAPVAYRALADLADEVAAEAREDDPGATVSAATVILAYFLKKGVGIVPRAAVGAHREEDRPRALAAASRRLEDPARVARIEAAVLALMRGRVLSAQVSFANALDRPVQVHWLHPDTQEEHLVAEAIPPGGVDVHSSHPGHRFVAYDAERAVRREFVVDAGYGEQQTFHVEL